MNKLKIINLFLIMIFITNTPVFAACDTPDQCRQQYFDITNHVQKSYLGYFNNLQLGSTLGGGRFQGKLARELIAMANSPQQQGGQLSTNNTTGNSGEGQTSGPQKSNDASGIRYN